MSDQVIIQSLCKSFGTIKALNNLSFTVKHDELFGLIGADGAGKTTLFRVLASLLIPDSGTATVLGFDVVSDYKSIRRSIGYMPGKFSLYQDLTVQENLEFFATLFGTTIEENYDLIREIYSPIQPFRNRRAGKLSGGMKQKLALSCALIHAPRLLLLDEPTTGVDPVSRKEFWEMLSGLKAKGITVIVSTPYMDEAARCDRIALIQQGVILTIDTPSGIAGKFNESLYGISSPDKYQLICDLRSFPYTESVFLFGENVHYADVRPMPPAHIISSVTEFLGSRNHGGITMQKITPGIEDVFMKLMNPPAQKTTGG